MSHRNVIRRKIHYPIFLASRLRDRQIRFVPEQERANGLKMCLAPLQLLGHRVQVAEPPLEGTGVGDRGRTRHFVYQVRRFLCLVNGVSRGKPDTHALLNRKLVAGYDLDAFAPADYQVAFELRSATASAQITRYFRANGSLSTEVRRTGDLGLLELLNRTIEATNR